MADLVIRALWGGSGKRSLRSLPLAKGQTIGKLALAAATHLN